MKRYLFLVLCFGVFGFTSCATSTDSSSNDEGKVLSATVEAAKDYAVSKVDTSLAPFRDSLKSDINSAAQKIKDHSKEVGKVTKEKVNEGVDVIKQNAQKVKQATRAGVEAVKEEFKK